jgi:eukaryotic-like serine/threonine-protein kinase
MHGPAGLARGLFAGRYSVERLLGQGATATVHLARDTQRGVAVALKILRPELVESRATGLFLKEIRRTSALQHSHILAVLDSGEYDGRPFFVLPYMEGGTLRALLDREAPLPFGRGGQRVGASLRTIRWASGCGAVRPAAPGAVAADGARRGG